VVGLFFVLYFMAGTAIGVTYCVFQDDDWGDHPEVIFLFAGWPFTIFGYGVRYVALKVKAKMKKDASRTRERTRGRRQGD
jgi:hypothetical protein